ncbi:hypothetical protein MTP99_011432 [Tenebrio molitor]|nr:hypothetical protein MTP99_011432 [Tenebrio molitor]
MVRFVLCSHELGAFYSFFGPSRPPSNGQTNRSCALFAVAMEIRRAIRQRQPPPRPKHQPLYLQTNTQRFADIRRACAQTLLWVRVYSASPPPRWQLNPRNE